ncbi:LysR family transcriptional regulator [Paralimibaculum aggregatum]|uniref:LysR family transcriptional regulator n=1 Tax=Paralimibaculum aggregatum TaxID=3036245 RepID=A0ABQ6LF47_9RHOB|nr:LysR family transcriptional regulator [Limibaculum sp. NKW23]GMG81962.1 LysR family transcriptional regulator [Limibaculum sp. NKW23]
MTPRALQSLVAIAEHGSLSRAAEVCHLTLSAVSMQMKALEAELGASLFDRTTRPPRLTPLGRAAAEEARALLAAERRLRDLCAGPGLAGEWRIGFIQTASVRILPGFLARAAAQAPRARFAVETGLSESFAQAVARGRLDAAVITRADPVPPGLRLVTLASEELVYALPPGAQRLAPAEAFARLRFLQFAPETGIGRLVAAHLAAAGLQPARRVVLDGIEAIMESVAGGLGFTALPAPDVARYAGPGVTMRPMRDPALTREVVLAVLAGSPAEREADRLAALMRG